MAVHNDKLLIFLKHLSCGAQSDYFSGGIYYTSIPTRKIVASSVRDGDCYFQIKLLRFTASENSNLANFGSSVICARKVCLRSAMPIGIMQTRCDIFVNFFFFVLFTLTCELCGLFFDNSINCFFFFGYVGAIDCDLRFYAKPTVWDFDVRFI